MNHTKGQSIIELLIAIGLSLLILPALFSLFFSSREGRAQQEQRLGAVALAREAEEITRNIRERGWDTFTSFTLDSTYHPASQSGVWTLSSGSESVRGYTRSITFRRVYRDGSGAIAATGTEDLSTRRADIIVSWATPFASSIQLAVYLTRHENILVTDTTDVDFNAGIATNAAVRNISGGEVVLGSTGGLGDWCNPSLTITALDLPKSGVANAISAIQGQIAAGTGENASGVSYANVLISDPLAPTNPVASVSGTFDGYKTNDVFTEQNYAYLATDNNAKEVVIINLSQKDSNNKYAESGYFNAPGNGNGSSIATSGNVGYMLDATKLYSFDLTAKNGSRPILDPDGVTLAGTGNRLAIFGSRAYIVTQATTAQLTIVDISNPSNLSIRQQIPLAALGGAALYVNPTGTRAFVATHQSSTQRELFIINIQESSPQFASILGTYDTSGMEPKGVVVVSGPRAIIVGTGAEEYQVVDITNESTSPLPRCGGLQLNSGINGVSTVFTSANRAYSYIITGDATTELKIIEGGPGSNGSDFVLNGTFVSRIFDVASISTGSAMAVFNRIAATISKSTGITDITVQVAAADPISSSCTNASYVFVGPNGTTSTYFTSVDNQTITGTIPFSNDSTGFENPARCFRYKAYLSTIDSTFTSQLLDMTISLSP